VNVVESYVGDPGPIRSRDRAGVGPICFQLNKKIGSAKMGIKELQATGLTENGIPKRRRRKPDHGSPSPNSTVVRQEQIDLAKSERMKLTSPANAVAGVAQE